MASHTGSEGIVKIGSNTIAEVRSWNTDEQADVIENTSMGDTARSYAVGLTGWTGSVDVLWDETDTNGQGACDVGASLTFNFYPEGATTGDIYYTGTGLVTGHNRTASFDGNVEASISVQGNGLLTESTV